MQKTFVNAINSSTMDPSQTGNRAMLMEKVQAISGFKEENRQGSKLNWTKH